MIMNLAHVICILLTIITVGTVHAVQLTHAICSSTHWGPPNCLNHCHCDSGDVACREEDGHCTSGICARGWEGMPVCDQECKHGKFGTNCMHTCHCPQGDVCSKINGICQSGECARGWSGPSCQTRLPELSESVQVSRINQSSMTATWRHWSEKQDPGSGPIVYYTLDYQMEGETSWLVATTVLEDNTTVPMSYTLPNLRQDTSYRFRLVLGFIRNDKWVISVAGFPSLYYRTLASGETTKSTQTPLTTPHPSTNTNTNTPWTGVTPDPVTQPPGPEKPVAVHLVFRNQSHIRVEWKLTDPKFHWCWSKYNVTLLRLPSGDSGTRRRRGTDRHSKITTEPRATFNNLDPASKYRITVESVPEKDALPFTAEITVWTIPRYMQPTRPATFINATDTTVAVMLYGVTENEAEVKNYQVIVENLSENKQDNITGLVSSVAAGLSVKASIFYGYAMRNYNKQHPNTHIAAHFDDQDIHKDGTPFVVGDDKIYRSYPNVPLEKKSEYAVWLVANYKWKGTVVPQFSHSEKTFMPSVLAPAKVIPWHTHWNYIIAIVVIVILLVIAGLIIYFLVWKRQNEKYRYFTRFPIFRRTGVPCKTDESTQIQRLQTPTAPTKYKPRRSLYEELDFESSGPPIHVPKTHGVVATDASYVALRNSNPIKVEKLKQYCVERITTDYSISEEYRHLPIGLIDTVYAATKPNNALMNRTSHIIPYDSNRIKVAAIVPGGEGHDYINASLVKTHLHTFYVVTQCPMAATIGEFWRMVWEQEVAVIIALLDMDEPDKPEYTAYWPKIDDHPLLYHDVRVSCNGSERSAHYTIRTFYLSRLVGDREQIRVVRHYQFVSWSKTGIPKYTAPFLDFMDRVADGHRKNPKAMLVHCHSGGGRSGMFVAIDSLITEGQRKGSVDVLKCVTKLRQERPNMVKHLKQYMFIYEALVDYFLCADSAADAPTFHQKYKDMSKVNRNMNNSRPQLALEYEAIEGFRNLPLTPTNTNNITRDFNDLFVSPIKKSTMFRLGKDILTLNPCEEENEQLSYSLVAAFMDSFSHKDAFIVSKHPQKEQINDFWDIIMENKCSAVVSLNSTDNFADKAYIPETLEKPSTATYGAYQVTVPKDACIINAFMMTDLLVNPVGCPEPEKNQRLIKNFEFTNWLAHSDVPSVKHMLSLIQQVREWRCGHEGPVVVLSNKGCDRAIIFCLLWSVFERIDTEGKINLFRAVLHHRKFVQSTVYNACQYRFIYQCANEYISERPSCYSESAFRTDLSNDGADMFQQLLLHSQTLPAAPSEDQANTTRLSKHNSGESPNKNNNNSLVRSPSPTPSQLSAQINEAAFNQTISDLSTWFSSKDQKVDILTRSQKQEEAQEMPDLDEEDLERERQGKFDDNLLKLFRMK